MQAFLEQRHNLTRTAFPGSHCLHHAALKLRVIIAVDADSVTPFLVGSQESDILALAVPLRGRPAQRGLAGVLFVRRKILAIHFEHPRVLAIVNRVGTAAGGDEHRACREFNLLPVVDPVVLSAPDQSAKHHSLNVARNIQHCFRRVQALRIKDTFLQGFLDFLVIPQIGRRLVHRTTVNHGHAAPRPQQRRKIWRFVSQLCT